MIIDFHTHIFPNFVAERAISGIAESSNLIPYTNGTQDGLLNSMKESGVDVSVILPVATRPQQFETINTFAANINEKYEHAKGLKLISFGGIHPDSTNYKEELREIVKLGLKGIKLHPYYQNTKIDDIKYMRLIDYASELGLMISVHAGLDVGYPNQANCTVDGAKKVIDEVKPEKFILAHYGGFGFWDEVEEKLAGENVYLDTGFIFHEIKKEQFLSILRKHGSDKILFASDSPWGGQKETLEAIESFRLSEIEKKNLLYENARKLLQWES